MKLNLSLLLSYLISITVLYTISEVVIYLVKGDYGDSLLDILSAWGLTLLLFVPVIFIIRWSQTTLKSALTTFVIYFILSTLFVLCFGGGWGGIVIDNKLFLMTAVFGLFASLCTVVTSLLIRTLSKRK